MSDIHDNLRELYQEVIFDHNRNPRNFHSMPEADHRAEGDNPLCGDQLTVYLRIEDGVIRDASFVGHGCAISKSSASVMTTLLKGKSTEEARALFERFHGMITSDHAAPLDAESLGKLAVFSGVREYPVRIKCATLPWHTMLAALKGETGKPVSTE